MTMQDKQKVYILVVYNGEKTDNSILENRYL